MKRILCDALAGALICGALAFGQTGAETSGQKPEIAAPSHTAQDPTATAIPPSVGGVQVLSDTEGVDFGPYINSVRSRVRENWYKLIPPSARAPKMARGDVSIEFAILRNGEVTGMKLVENSGDVGMGNAWHAITDSRFPPLPTMFQAEYLALRLHFAYNPPKGKNGLLGYRE